MSILNHRLPTYRMAQSPASIFAGGSRVGAWYDVNDRSTLMAADSGDARAAIDGKVARILDKSGNGEHLFQTTDSKRGTLRQLADGRLAIEMDGTDDYYRGGPAMAQPMTRVTSLRQLSWVSTDFIWGSATGGPTLSQSGSGTAPTLTMNNGGAAFGFPACTINEDVVITEHSDGLNSGATTGRNRISPINGGSQVIDEMLLGSRTTGGSQHANFYFYGAVAAEDMTWSERMAAVRWLDARKPTNSPVALVPCYGDSITLGSVASAGNAWVTKLQLQLGLNFRLINEGFSSQDSDNIAMRMDAVPWTINFPGNAIPTSGAATVTVVSPAADGEGVTGQGPLAFSSNTTRLAYVEALDGTLVEGVFASTSGGVYTFTRLVDGVAIPVAAAAPAHIDQLDRIGRPLAIPIMWMGRNNLDGLQGERLLDDILACADKHIIGGRGLIILPWNKRNSGIGTDEHDAAVAIKAAVEAEWPDNTLDLKAYLQSDGCFTALSLTKDGTDLADIAADTPPNSLMGDEVHPNNDGHQGCANGIEDKFVERGWA